MPDIENSRRTTDKTGRLIFIHHQCWEVLPFCRFQRQRCIKILCLRAQDFYTPLALKTAKGQHLPALVVYKNQPKMPVSAVFPTVSPALYLEPARRCFFGSSGCSQCQAFGASPNVPGLRAFLNFPEVPGLPLKHLSDNVLALKSIPEVPQKFPRLPQNKSKKKQ